MVTVVIDCNKNEAHLTFELWKLKNPKKYKQVIDRGCECCGLKESKFPKVLMLHHIDGDRRNNVLSNLMCVCFNCHVQVHKDLNVVYLDSNQCVVYLTKELAKQSADVVNVFYNKYIKDYK